MRLLKKRASKTPDAFVIRLVCCSLQRFLHILYQQEFLKERAQAGTTTTLFIVPLDLIWAFIGAVFISIAVLINYGPF
ncbi:hypothetical protein [Oceanobacillus picturae]|uniref:hypothetical protein n=1 Tax=Oceanobacillus picturae TaxID=171693 RepID=UPI00073D47C7|nr:hypothetical protein [Oceanobacillus picturae]